MANKKLFNSGRGKHMSVPAANTVNKAGGKAYSMKHEHAMAQFAVTGMFTDTFYTNKEEQLKKAIGLANKCRPLFIAQCAVYAREKGYMKDMPAFLCAVLAARDVQLLKRVFNRVIDNGKMLRNFVQIIRSGVTGRRSLGNAPKKLIQKWFDSRSDFQLFRDSVGNDPSLSDVIKLARPRPSTPARDALYAYLIDKPYEFDALPQIVKDYESYKKNGEGKVPNVPFQMLTSLDLKEKEWKEIAENAKWMMTRMNLNTFNRHGVFKDSSMVTKVANRLKDAKNIKEAKAFPYQLLTAYNNTQDLPNKIKNALQDAMEVATENVPSFGNKKVYVLVDTSGSMGQSVGNSGKFSSYSYGSVGGTSCVQVASLIASCLMRVNDDVEIIPFDTSVHTCNLNPRDSVVTNTRILSQFGGGGTDCAAPLRNLNSDKAKGDLIVFVSDNESWFEGGSSNRFGWGYGYGTTTAHEWTEFHRRNKNAKCVCIDLVANDTVQITDSKDVMNVGGFSDNIWDIIKMFVDGEYGAEAWTKYIKQVDV